MAIKASCQVTGASGALVRRRGVVSCFRASAGVYHVVFPADANIRLGEYDIRVTPVGAAARGAVLGNAGGVAPPGGANAPAGSLSIEVRTFQLTDGAAADADFTFSAERL